MGKPGMTLPAADRATDIAMLAATRDDDRVLFSAVLRPHRSLTPKGIRLVIGLVALAGLIAAIPFIVFGFWPVAGFYGLDIALLWWAFRINMKDAESYETITLSQYHLAIEKVPHRGLPQHWHFNPVWTSLHKDVTDDQTLKQLALVSKGETVTIADCLNSDDKTDFGKALPSALATAIRGPRFDHP
jgi:uncharacterized membrane protein